VGRWGTLGLSGIVVFGVHRAKVAARW
jgi:hypothetical protein